MTEAIYCEFDDTHRYPEGEIKAFTLQELHKAIRTEPRLAELSFEEILEIFDFDSVCDRVSLPHFVTEDIFTDPDTHFLFALRIESVFWKPENAEYWRDELFNQFKDVVRMAYVMPTWRGIYLICEGVYRDTGDESYKAQERMYAATFLGLAVREYLDRHYELDCCYVIPSAWCYLYHDSGAKYRDCNLKDSDTSYRIYKKYFQDYMRQKDPFLLYKRNISKHTLF